MLALVAFQPAVIHLHALATLEVVAKGLVNPRGLNFGPEGALYVAEAGNGGTGPCFVNSAKENVCYGPTGAVTRVTLGGVPTQERVVTGLPSLAPENGSESTGPHDVDFQGRGNGFVTIGLGADPDRRQELGTVGSLFGHLVRFQPNGGFALQEDLSGFEALANPDHEAVDSNPYGLLALPGRAVYTDAGGNALNAVAANGSISNLAVFPNRTVPHPFIPNATVPMQAVPTTVTLGPDGALYVGQLSGFPFPPGGANVYRVPANGGAPQVFASGFTNIIDIAFAPDGSLYVLQFDASSILFGNADGSLIRVSPDGTKTTIVPAGAGLVAPGGIAIGPDGAIYVTNLSVSPGDGTVVKIVP